MSRRSTNWTFLVWCDSTPNWRNIIEEYHVAWCESPVHEYDTNEDGSQKKCHRHIALTFDSLKSFDQVKEITDQIGTTIPMPVQSMKGLIQYFTHKNNPEKYQYNEKDIIPHGGFDLQEYLKPTQTEYEELAKSLDQFIIDNGITEFNELVLAVVNMDEDRWLYILRNRNTAFYKTWLQNRSYNRRQSNEKQ